VVAESVVFRPVPGELGAPVRGEEVMDFANEYYVRIYTRDTTTWKRLAWDGQNVLMQMLRKMDMAGVLDIEDMEPWEAVVLHCPDAPEDVARRGMALCLRFGVIEHNGHFLVAPKYREANEANKSDRQRQVESRARRRASALERSVTPRDVESQDVTDNGQPSHDVTVALRGVTSSHVPKDSSHALSHGVTLTNSDPNSDTGGDARSRAISPPPAPAASQNGTRNGASSPKLTGEAEAGASRLWAIWELAVGGELGTCGDRKPHMRRLCELFAACSKRAPGEPEALWRRVVEAYVAEARAKSKRCDLAYLSTDFGGYADQVTRSNGPSNGARGEDGLTAFERRMRAEEPVER
jgi:hypothetical protein